MRAAYRPRHLQRPRNDKLTEEETRVLEWMQWGGSLQAAAQLTETPLCRALEWLEAGRAHSHGPHGIFAREVGKLTPPPRAPMTMTGCNGLAARNGTGHLGTGSANLNGNGSQPLLTPFADL